MYVLLIRDIEANENKVPAYETKNLRSEKLEGNSINTVINTIMEASIGRQQWEQKGETHPVIRIFRFWRTRRP